jgi:GH24 family phage-related lysozyme (muramidase)
MIPNDTAEGNVQTIHFTAQNVPATVSDQGLEFMRNAEHHGPMHGDPNSVYDDKVGNPTAGWGHKLTVEENRKYKIGDIVDLDTQKAWFKNDVKNAERAVRNAVTNPNMTQNQFDALADLAYNSAGFSTSHLVSEFNKGHLMAATFEFEDWNAQRGTDVGRGLDTRRANEQRLFSKGNYTYDHGLHTNLWNSTNPSSPSYTPNTEQFYRSIINSIEKEGEFNKKDY